METSRIRICLADKDARKYDALMLRGLLILTVVASLVWCPVRCLASVASSVSSVTEKPAARKCACCRHRAADAETAASKPSTPIQQSGDCDCPDCLCKGAVLGSNVPVDVAVAITPLNIVATEALGFSDVPCLDADLFDVPIPSARSGSDLVVLYGNMRR